MHAGCIYPSSLVCLTRFNLFTLSTRWVPNLFYLEFINTRILRKKTFGPVQNYRKPILFTVMSIIIHVHSKGNYNQESPTKTSIYMLDILNQHWFVGSLDFFSFCSLSCSISLCTSLFCLSTKENQYFNRHCPFNTHSIAGVKLTQLEENPSSFTLIQ